MTSASLSLFLFAALIIAVVPGPGIFYVAARTLSGGRRAGLASTIGTGLGGMVHVVAGALGVSAIILASAELFATLKLIGACYLEFGYAELGPGRVQVEFGRPAAEPGGPEAARAGAATGPGRQSPAQHG